MPELPAQVTPILKFLPIAGLVVAGLIHLLPVAGVLGPATLTRLYGVPVVDPNTAILLQHRAVLFGVLGLFMLAAAALPPLRLAALLVGLASAASFLLVARWVGGYNAAIGRVVTADVIATAALAAGLVAELLLSARRGL
jgi:hypothetical protein